MELDEAKRTLQMTTAPPADQMTPAFSFLSYSCNKPYIASRGGILARDISLYNTMLARAEGRLTFMGDEYAAPSKPSFAMGLGDQIYVAPGRWRGRGRARAL